MEMPVFSQKMGLWPFADRSFFFAKSNISQKKTFFLPSAEAIFCSDSVNSKPNLGG